MRHLPLIPLAIFALSACGANQAPGSSTPADARTAPSVQAGASSTEGDTAGGESSPGGEGKVEEVKRDGSTAFKIRKSKTARAARGVRPSKIKATPTEAAIKLFVVDKNKGPIRGIVISLTAPDGKKYYTEETDTEGYAEVLVPVGQKYDLVYLSLGRRKISAQLPVSGKPNQNLKLTLRYNRYTPPKPPPMPTSAAPIPAGTPVQAPAPSAPRFVLKGVEFDTAKAIIRPESFTRLDGVLEYMTHKKSSRVEISGHTDNVGKPRKNQKLSERRANACRDYLISQGIDGSRIEAVGFGDQRPIASNDNEAGRQKNRRIEATEL